MEETREIRMPIVPGPPETLEETGLSLAFLVELACKTLYFGGVLSLSSISEQLALPVSVANDVMEFLKRERLAEVRKGGDIHAASTFALTDLGRERAREYLQHLWVHRRRPRHAGAVHGSGEEADGPEDGGQPRVGAPRLRGRRPDPRPARTPGPGVQLRALDLPLWPLRERQDVHRGAAGEGAERGRLHPTRDLRGQPGRPRVRPGQPLPDRYRNATRPGPPFPDEPAGFDRRWVLCERPVVVSGGELTLAMLDLNFDPVSNFYEAPLQMKANGGVFLIDDLGRQLVRPHDLLNRWIVPLEKGRDYLTLKNGKKFEIPFDQIILFSTNIEPRQLADEAFLRRIGYKIKIDDLREEEYAGIFRQVCEHLGVACRPEVIRYLVDEEHGLRGIQVERVPSQRRAEPCRGDLPIRGNPHAPGQGDRRAGVQGLLHGAVRGR